MNTILNNEDLNSLAEEPAGNSNQVTSAIGSADNATMVCNNSVCMVTWKPTRPSAAA